MQHKILQTGWAAKSSAKLLPNSSIQAREEFCFLLHVRATLSALSPALAPLLFARLQSYCLWNRIYCILLCVAATATKCIRLTRQLWHLHKAISAASASTLLILHLATSPALTALAVSMCLAFIKVQTVPNRWAWELIENLFHAPDIFFGFSAIYFPANSVCSVCPTISYCLCQCCHLRRISFTSIQPQLGFSPSLSLPLPNSNSFALLTVCLHAPVKVQGRCAYK